ncbi:hypothetical protein MCOR07_010419 [Pyricularia oryzae]
MNGATQALSGASEAPSTEDAQQQQSSSGSNGTPAGEGNGAAAAAAAAAAGLKKRKKDALKPIITTENPAPTSQPAPPTYLPYLPTYKPRPHPLYGVRAQAQVLVAIRALCAYVSIESNMGSSAMA